MLIHSLPLFHSNSDITSRWRQRTALARESPALDLPPPPTRRRKPRASPSGWWQPPPLTPLLVAPRCRGMLRWCRRTAFRALGRRRLPLFVRRLWAGRTRGLTAEMTFTSTEYSGAPAIREFLVSVLVFVFVFVVIFG